MKRTGTTLIIVFISCFYLHAQTVIQDGNVFGVWNAENSPFLVEGNINVPADERLEIKAGVEVIFQGQFTFEIAGRIVARGTSSDNITFTVQDTTGFSTGNYTGWSGLVFDGMLSSLAENSFLEYCNIEYSSQNGLTCIGYSELEIENCNISHNLNAGISLYENSNITINSIIISNNHNGGISCYNSAVQVFDFQIEGNSGSGVIVSGNSSSAEPATFINGIINNNTLAMSGGGLNLSDDAGVYFEDVEIVSNSAVNGGGIYCDMAGGWFINVVISDNSADYGGGIKCGYYVNLTFDHTLISDNHANFDGGGFYIFESNIEFKNGTISNNIAENQGGGLYYYVYSASPSEINNSIIWNNYPEEILSNAESPIINFSDVMGGYVGNGNIDADPLFVDTYNGDYHLQWSGFPEENTSKSPCIDTGDPNVINDPDGTISDMGAFFFDQGYITYIDNKMTEENINIYPNPAYNELNIKSDEIYSRLVISDMTGKIVIDQNTNNSIMNIDVSGLNSGIYLIYIYNKDRGIIKRKFIKK